MAAGLVTSVPFAEQARAVDCVPVDSFARSGLWPSSLTQPEIAGAGFGDALAAGDFNKDGFKDLVVGAPGDVVGTAAAGAAYVFPGSTTGPKTTGTGARRLTETDLNAGNEAGDKFGSALAVGDVNKDLYDDLVVGIPGEAVDTSAGAGAIGLFLGGPNGLTTGKWLDQVQLGAGASEADDRFGSALAVGDFNQDGFADVAIGTPGEAPGALPKGGSVVVMRGAAGTGIGTTYGVLESIDPGATVETNDLFGFALAAGDLTGDGLVDLAIGAPGESPGSLPSGGLAQVVKGSASGLVFHRSFTQDNFGNANVEPEDDFGYSLAIGNFNGTGSSDLAVGSPGEAPGGSSADKGTSGMAFEIAGPVPASGTISANGLVPGDGGEIVADGDRFGQRLAAGDVDADGKADLLVGSPLKDTEGSPSNSGVAYLYGGSSRGSGLELAKRVAQTDLGYGNETDDRFGSAVLLADLTGDGKAEQLIGIRNEKRGTSTTSGGVSYATGLSTGLSLGGLAGATTQTTAKIWVRGNEATGTYQVQYRPTGTTTWLTAPQGTFGALATADLTAVTTLSGLSAGTGYDYRIAVNCRVVPWSNGTFRTLPATTATTTSFAYSADIRNPVDQTASGRIPIPFQIVDRIVADKPDLLMLDGDQIYSDLPVDTAAMTLPQYFAKYRANWGEVNLRAGMASISTYMMWDDHEIENNYPQTTDPATRYAIGRSAFEVYQSSHNPAALTAGNLYYTVRSGPVEFFVTDGRTFRSPQTTWANRNDPTRTMLGATQLAQLKTWLSTSTAKFKVIVSADPMADRSCGPGSDSADAWCGYAYERGQIFNHINTNQIKNVLVFSGDQHWSAAVRLNVGSGKPPITEIQASALGGVAPGSPRCVTEVCSYPTETPLWADTGENYVYALAKVAPGAVAGTFVMTVQFKNQAGTVLRTQTITST